jgi:hypothetical protein
VNNKKFCERCGASIQKDIIDKNKGYCEYCNEIINKSNTKTQDDYNYVEDLYGKLSSRIHSDDT